MIFGFIVISKQTPDQGTWRWSASMLPPTSGLYAAVRALIYLVCIFYRIHFNAKVRWRRLYHQKLHLPPARTVTSVMSIAETPSKFFCSVPRVALAIWWACELSLACWGVVCVAVACILPEQQEGWLSGSIQICFVRSL